MWLGTSEGLLLYQLANALRSVIAYAECLVVVQHWAVTNIANEDIATGDAFSPYFAPHLVITQPALQQCLPLEHRLSLFVPMQPY